VVAGEDSVLVSVVIPAYNAADTLERCVMSVASQTHRNLEMLLVDDSSEDATVEVARRLCEGDPRIRLILKDRNTGAGPARNVGLSASSGEWIMLVDSDDAIEPWRTERMLKSASKADATIIFDNPFEIGVGKRLDEGRPALVADCGLFGELALETYARSISSISRLPNLGYLKPMFTRSLVTDTGVRYHEGLKVGEDSLFVCGLFASGGKGHLIPDPGYLYYRRGDSLSSAFGATRMGAMRDAFLEFSKRQEGLTAGERTAVEAVVEDLAMRFDAQDVFVDKNAMQMLSMSRRFLAAPRGWVYLVRELRSRVWTTVAGWRRGATGARPTAIPRARK
jgi:succinoglycan biosynthesis protein ExoO